MSGAHRLAFPPAKRTPPPPPPSRRMQAAGQLEDARERYAELVARHQRRAARIAYHYLRDAAEADEAVQDAFVKAYQHLASFREELPFDVWFTRILINGCLDRIKARTRRERWLVPMSTRHARRGPGAPNRDLDRAGRRRRACRRRKRCSDASGGEQIARGAGEAARAAAIGVRAEPRGRAHVAGSQRADGTERVDRSRAPVPRDTQAAGAAGERLGAAAGELKGKRRVTS